MSLFRIAGRSAAYSANKIAWLRVAFIQPRFTVEHTPRPKGRSFRLKGTRNVSKT